MSFRDDHDAALARAAALERELRRERAETAAAKAMLAHAEQVNARLEADANRPRATDPSLLETMRPLRPWFVLVAVGGLGIATLLSWWLGPADDDSPDHRALRRRSGLHASVNRYCHLDTAPTGATIYAQPRDPHGPMVALGSTPMELSLDHWVRRATAYGAHFEARLDGYPPMTVEVPVVGTQCRDTVYAFGGQR